MGKNSFDNTASEARKNQGRKEKHDLLRNRKTKEHLGSSHKTRRNFNRKTAGGGPSNTSFVCSVIAVVGLIVALVYIYYETVQSLDDTAE